MAKLLVLQKGYKPLDEACSYKPICLLNTIGQLFERFIKGRLEIHLNENGDLNEKPFGFRKGRSTVDVIQKVMNTVQTSGSGPLYKRKLCMVVSLDLANAFNSGKWGNILDAVQEKHFPRYIVDILQSYLSDSRVDYEEMSW